MTTNDDDTLLDKDVPTQVKLDMVLSMKTDLLGEAQNGQSRTAMIENAIAASVQDQETWNEVIRLLTTKARMFGVKPEQYIKQILKQRGYDRHVDLDKVDFSPLLYGSDSLPIGS